MSEAGRDARNTYAAFSAMWAIAILFHIGSYVHWGRNLHYFALAAAAVWLLVRPASVGRLLLVAALQLYEFWDDTPFVPNHSLVVAFVHVTVMAAVLRLVIERKSFQVEGGELLGAFAPAVRLELLVLYFFAAFHKLNTDYFDPVVSCANFLYEGQRSAFPFLPGASIVGHLTVYASFATEAAIPVLLAIRKTRNAGILLGVGFHSLIVINPYAPAYNFSSMLFALYLLFAPASLVTQARAWLGTSPLRGRLAALAGTRFSYGNLALLILASLGGLALLALAERWPPPGLDLPHSSRGFLLLFFELYSGVLVTLFLVTLARSGRLLQADRGTFALRYAWLAIFPALMFANGWSPYLGLKTEQVFSMFSNLRTEGGRTNHFLVPTSTQAFDFQRDLVQVVASPNRRLSMAARDDTLYTFFEFHRRASDLPRAPVTYVRNGTRVELAAVQDDPELAEPLPYLEAKLLHFRPIDTREKQHCAH